MAKTLATIQQQIQKLQEQADALKRKEAVGVIEKIKAAIDFYGLTPADLFDSAPTTAKKRVSSAGATELPEKKVRRKRGTVVKKPAAPAKFTDGTKSWSGHGKRPQWFKDAIESGKTPEDLAVKTD